MQGIFRRCHAFFYAGYNDKALQLDGTQEILLTDTVELSESSHHLIETFKKYTGRGKICRYHYPRCRCIESRMDEQMYVVYDTLRQMGAEGENR